MKTKTLRLCKNGHRYYKSSDCPVCPQCEKEKQQAGYFIPGLSVPARRALTSKGIHSLPALAGYSEKEILALHGIGKTTLPKLRAALKAGGLSFQ